MKFTSYEANGIQPLVANSPIMGWLYRFLSVQGFSDLLGVVEIAIAMMIGKRWLSPRVSAIGSTLAIVMFLTTLSFLFSTPGWEPSLGGFPALAVVPGQFLLKDIVLLGGSIWSLGESLASIGASRNYYRASIVGANAEISSPGRKLATLSSSLTSQSESWTGHNLPWFQLPTVDFAP